MNIDLTRLTCKTTHELTEIRKGLVQSLEACMGFGVTEALGGLAHTIDTIDAVLNERAEALCEMREFTSANWRAYPGCCKFLDGSEPWIGKCGELEVLVDPRGLFAYYDGHEVSRMELSSKALCIELGNVLLNKVRGLSYAEALGLFGLSEEA